MDILFRTLYQGVNLNLGLAYKTLKVAHITNYTYLYEMPLKNYAVVQYASDDEEIVFSQFFFEYVDALHCFNNIKGKRIDED